jgi:predicted dinucleotide-binding enzyme
MRFKRNVHERSSEVKIATIGRGNVGGGLAKLWEQAGHEVQRIGSDGGDVSDAEAALLAVPSGAIDDALRSVSGLEGKTLIDATNLLQGERPGGANSLAEYVKQVSGANVAKALNTVFAALYDQVADQRVRPSCLYCGEEAAKEPTAQLVRDAGYEPVDAGGLENARLLEDFLRVTMAVSNASLGRTFYRFAKPGEL